ncbi:copper transporter [Cellulomonas massiliensis]|uniref:copper transporter n=1 Tax=Cellulomonas massiliensis TaxID=1465811 RepID=UPI0002FEF8F1|nr:copper transporter [Cellulomonas massiliensis]
MIDFRYHVVSLISVFLALAVGIALGAGPLKETIGDTLTGQVEQLRSEKDALRAELDDANARVAAGDAYVDAAAPTLLAGVMPERRVAVVALGEVEPAVLEAIDQRLDQAGATVTAHATLTDAWTSAALRDYRQALAGSLVQYLQPAPDASAGLEVELGYALVQGLTAAQPEDPDALSADASSLLAVLSSTDSQDQDPLVTLADPVTTPADAVVVVAPPLDADAATPSPVDEQVQAAQLAVVTAAQQLTDGAVLADGPQVTGSLTNAVLADDATAARVTTVSDAQLVTGAVSVPLALAARIDGTNGHYGSGPDLTVMPPRVQLPVPDRTPVTPQGD